ncbi:MAG: hypothetical protein EOP87_14920, partial [Verrucomicrobiaceae bacterium]
MKPLVLYLAVSVLALLAGWASGPGEGNAPADASFRQEGASPSRGEGKRWVADDFLRSLTGEPGSARFFPTDPLMAYLDKWTDEEIRTALDESLSDPELLLGASGSTGVTQNLFRQLIGRDFTAAIAFFAALPEHQKSALSQTLLWNWPAGHTEEGMEFVRANKLLCAGKEQRVVMQYLTEVAKRGAKDFIAAMQGLEGEGFEISHREFYSSTSGQVQGLVLPPGFDFSALFAPEGLGFRPELYGSFTNSAFGQWQKQDREAAFRWIMENHGIPSLALVGGGWGDDGGAWFNGKMTAMPADQRAEFLRDKLRSWAGEPANARLMVAAARDTPIYQEVMSHGVQGLFHGKYSSCIPIIEGIREPEERIRFLEKLEHLPTQERADSYSSPEQVAALRGKLSSWGADDARIDAILQRLEEGR